jgi:predicted 3-demethylubiquinone-9 3-methyltransferase (glyoxalase superfamily)
MDRRKLFAFRSPPLVMDRKNVLDRYFNDIVIEIIESEETGWVKIKNKISI